VWTDQTLFGNTVTSLTDSILEYWSTAEKYVDAYQLETTMRGLKMHCFLIAFQNDFCWFSI